MELIFLLGFIALDNIQYQINKIKYLVHYIVKF